MDREIYRPKIQLLLGCGGGRKKRRKEEGKKRKKGGQRREGGKNKKKKKKISSNQRKNIVSLQTQKTKMAANITRQNATCKTNEHPTVLIYTKLS